MNRQKTNITTKQASTEGSARLLMFTVPAYCLANGTTNCPASRSSEWTEDVPKALPKELN